MDRYPTMEEIDGHKLSVSSEVFLAVEDWKGKWFEGWKGKKDEKFDALSELAFLICAALKLKLPDISAKDGMPYGWDEQSRTINMDSKHYSILSTLHEVGHMIHGPSELDACSFSIQIFKTCFPQSFKKLKADGHLLKSHDTKPTSKRGSNVEGGNSEELSSGSGPAHEVLAGIPEIHK